MNTVEQTTETPVSWFGRHSPRGWPLVLACLCVLILTGWGYMGLMIADMVPVMDMSEAGPAMGLFNLFNGLAGLPADVRAAITAMCLPTSAATFGMPAVQWSWIDGCKVFMMWLMMAFAMMLPTAIPMLRAYMGRVERCGSENSRLSAAARTLLVAGGYVLVWSAYAVLATFIQWFLTLAQALTPMMAPASLVLSATVLLAAGLYQFTPAKQACLYRCWYPRFVFTEERGQHSPAFEALREGVVQGIACLGCCWAVMTVMFAVGVMNVLWIAFLGVLMAIEKTLPSRWLYAVIGAILCLWGGALVAIILSAAH